MLSVRESVPMALIEVSKLQWKAPISLAMLPLQYCINYSEKPQATGTKVKIELPEMANPVFY